MWRREIALSSLTFLALFVAQEAIVNQIHLPLGGFSLILLAALIWSSINEPELAAVTGQKPVVARAKKSISSFKLRQGQAIGAFVTLRGERMYEFLDRLVTFSLPRVRDFRGVSPKGFDGKGNYTLGLKEQIIFPEINYDKVDKIRGMGITFVTTAQNNEEGRELLKLLGMPFREK